MTLFGSQSPRFKGDVSGPAASIDNAFPRYDGVTGKLLQDGQTVEDDSGNVTAAGVMYDTSDGLVFATGKTLRFDFQNLTGSDLPAGTVLTIDNATVTPPALKPAISTAEVRLERRIIGTAAHLVLDGETGTAMKSGPIFGVDTSGCIAGEEIYLSPSVPGGFTNVRPNFPATPVPVGGCLVSHPTEGVMFVGSQADTTPYEFNGCITERQDIFLLEDAGTVYLDVEKAGGGNLSAQLLGIVEYLDCTTGPGVGGRARVALTAGTPAVPVMNYIWVEVIATVPTLVAGTSFPASPNPYAPVASIYIQDAATVALYGGVWTRRHTDAMDNDGRGRISYIDERQRKMPPWLESGVVPSSAITPGTPDSVGFEVSSGLVYQLHIQTFSAKDIAVDGIFLSNASGAGLLTPFQRITDLNAAFETADGTAISNGNRYTLGIYGVISHSGAQCRLFVTLPLGTYNSDIAAYDDHNGLAVTSSPLALREGAFLIAKVPLKYTTAGGGTFEFVGDILGKPAIIDMRGSAMGSSGSASGSAAQQFSDAVFRLFDNLDSTKELAFELSGVTPSTTRTLAVPDADGTIALTSGAGTDHGGLDGLGDDDHAQYHTDARGDARYYTQAEHISTSAGAADAGKPIALDAAGHVDASMINDGDIDHLSIANIGTNSHAQLDTHLADGTVHYTEASIDHTAITNIGTNSHATIDAHLGDSTVHFTEASISHLSITDTGTNSHAVIDTHIADDTLHFTVGSIDHGSISGLGDDDHAQYHNDTRGDARYYTQTELDAGQLDSRYFTEPEHINTSVGAGDAGKPIVLNAAGIVDSTMLSGDVGDVLGPAASIDNAFPRYDGTTGKLLQGGQTTEDDSGSVTVFLHLDTGGNLSVGGYAQIVSSLLVGGGSYLSGLLDVTGAANFADVVTITDTTPSTSSTDGALVVWGGAGIAGDTHIDGSVHVGAGVYVNAVTTYTGSLLSLSSMTLTAPSGANIALYNDSHPVVAGEAYYDATMHTFSSVVGYTGPVIKIEAHDLAAGNDGIIEINTNASRSGIRFTKTTGVGSRPLFLVSTQDSDDRLFETRTLSADTSFQILTNGTSVWFDTSGSEAARLAQVDRVSAANVLGFDGILECSNGEDATDTTTGDVRIAGGYSAQGASYFSDVQIAPASQLTYGATARRTTLLTASVTLVASVGVVAFVVAGISATMPTAQAVGKLITVKNASSGSCTVYGGGAETIESAASITLAAGESAPLLWVGAAYGGWVTI